MPQGFRVIKNKANKIAKAKKLIAKGKTRNDAAKAIGISELTLRRWLQAAGVKPLKVGRPSRGRKAVDYTKVKYVQPKSISPTGKVGKKLVKSFLDAVIAWARGQKKAL